MNFAIISFVFTDQNSLSGSRTLSPSSSNSFVSNFGVSTSSSTVNFLSANNVDQQRMTLDISLLKKQYAKLKERQKQAQIILTGKLICF